MTITIYQNPDCGTSRNTMAMIRQSGEEPVVIEYLKTPPDRATLVKLIADAGLTSVRRCGRKIHPSTRWACGFPRSATRRTSTIS